jgi:predicted dehydrogenase
MDSQHRILVIGVGSIGHRHLRCFKATGRAALSLCEPNGELAKQVAELNGVDKVFSNLDAALQDPPEAAVIATPAPLHIPMATQLAKAGVHLLIEKPLSVSLDGIDALADVLQTKSIKAAVAYVHRANPILREMREAVLSGRFGRPVEVLATCGSHFPTYRPAYRQIYYNNRATGGGAIQDALTHIINAVEWFVGPTTRLAADAAHQLLDGVDVEDTVHMIARNGAVMTSYGLNQYQSPNEITLTVVCERGTARAELHRCRWRWMIQPDEPWHDEQHEKYERDAFFVRQANTFLDFLEGTSPPLCTLEEAKHTLRGNLAALTSSDRGTWENID